MLSKSSLKFVNNNSGGCWGHSSPRRKIEFWVSETAFFALFCQKNLEKILKVLINHLLTESNIDFRTQFNSELYTRVDSRKPFCWQFSTPSPIFHRIWFSHISKCYIHSNFSEPLERFFSYFATYTIPYSSV
jgi:hypothetical protein